MEEDALAIIHNKEKENEEKNEEEEEKEKEKEKEKLVETTIHRDENGKITVLTKWIGLPL